VEGHGLYLLFFACIYNFISSAASEAVWALTKDSLAEQYFFLAEDLPLQLLHCHVNEITLRTSDLWRIARKIQAGRLAESIVRGSPWKVRGL
jgi:hypothetical protein